MPGAPADVVALRPYRPGDADRMYELDRVCFAETFQFSRRTMRQFAEAPGAMCVVAEAQGLLTGFCIAETDGGRTYLVTLDVDPAWRRHGIGGRLLGWIEHRAVALGASRMELHVFAGNGPAISSYERTGFVLRGREAGFYGRGMDALVYAKPLGGT